MTHPMVLELMAIIQSSPGSEDRKQLHLMGPTGQVSYSHLTQEAEPASKTLFLQMENV
jgi:hypothetical protein